MDLRNSACSVSPQPTADLNLETVRALHQTVVALRAALEQSRSELFELRLKVNSNSNSKVYAETIEKLALENHILRERVLSSSTSKKMESLDEANNPPALSVPSPSEEASGDISEPTKVEDSASGPPDTANNKPAENTNLKDEPDEEIGFTERDEVDAEEKPGLDTDTSGKENSPPEENETDGCEKSSAPLEATLENDEAPSSLKDETSGQLNGEKSKVNQDSDNESEELDDIELIFTTEETKELGVMQEDLVSISDSENWTSVKGQPNLPITVEKSTQFDEESTGLRMPWAHTVVVDISKCGIIDENEAPTNNNLRRNTLPSPMPYRPIIHKEVLSASKSPSHGIKFSASRSPRTNGSSDSKRLPMRPILVEPNSSPKCESEAQTDITALPSHWKSESYLAHKVSHQFTTLPSKFTLPTRQAMHSRPSLKICDRGQDARRVLLSDINFTSMVPELSRSADHLALESGVPSLSDTGNLAPTVAGLYRNFPRAFSYMKNPDVMGPCLVSPGYQHTREYGRFQWSPCDCAAQYSTRYQSPQSSATSPQPHDVDIKLRPELKSATSSLDVCRHGHLIQRSMSSSSWQSEPASPTRCLLHGRTHSVPLATSFNPSRSKHPGPALSCGFRHSASSSFGSHVNRARGKVSFQDNCLQRQGRGGQSLPDLRVTDVHGDSGDSTDSLIDEAEDYVRRSIDSIVTRTDMSKISRRRMIRRHSDPDPIRDLVPPKSAQPYLPKGSSDLKLDHLVKVIIADGRVTVGRVRYVGAVAGLADSHVGVELPTPSGDSDGSFRGRRYFECNQSHSLFVPFKKVIMAWRT